MFLQKYIEPFYFELILTNYNNSYLNQLDESNFIEVYRLFQKKQFYFIEDIILNYLELFEIDPKYIEQALTQLEAILGDQYIFEIGEHMELIDRIISLALIFEEKDI